MKLKEIISQSNWQDVAIAIVTEHPCQRKNLEGFRIVFETLSLMESTESEYQIRIERRADMLDSEYTYPDVFGVKEDDEISYSLVFTPWTEWLGMDICQETLDPLSPSQITAYCLHEMTFFGFTEEQRKQQEASLDESIKEAKEHPEDLIELNPDDLHIEISMKEYLRCLDRWLRWSTLSREYFGENASWFKNRFLVGNAPGSYDELDRQTLKAALKEVARDIMDVAKKL